MATPGQRTDGASLLRLRNKISSIVDEATPFIEQEAGMTLSPAAQLLVVDRHSWIVGNVRTLEGLMPEIEMSRAGSSLVALEGGALVGMLARLVLGQYDPFRDQLLIVYPNLGDFGHGSGLRWLLLHELTHVAQFRAAPWMTDQIVEAGRQAMSDQDGWSKETMRQFRQKLPEIVRWARRVLQGQQPLDPDTSPVLELLPKAQRESLLRVHALVTVLEGHATYVTELVGKQVLPDYEAITRRIEARRRRPPLMRLLETVFGLEMKRRQYVVGRGFCEAVWKQGGAEALAPVWQSPEHMPTSQELHHPDQWMARVTA